MKELNGAPFLLLEKEGNQVVSDIFRENHLTPDIRFTTWDDYAIMAMVENGLGISILPELILGRVPWRIAVRPLEIPAYREIGFAVSGRTGRSPTVREFMKYLDRR